MVVLDGHNMLGAGPNQYLQPDYLSPLPTTLDAKKSPLALLAQTCSQIGADSPSTKSLMPSIHESCKRKSSSSSESSSLKLDLDARESNSRPRSSGSGSGIPIGKSSAAAGKSSPAFKPYENSSTTNNSSKIKEEKIDRSEQRDEKPKTPKNSGLSSSPAPGKNSHRTSPPVSSSSSISVSSASPTINTPSSTNNNNNNNNSIENGASNTNSNSKSSSSSSSSPSDGKHSPKSSSGAADRQGSSPIIRSGLEVLHGHLSGKDYGKASAGALSSLSALAGYPPGFDPTNPALRPPFFAPPHHPLSAGHFMGYPPSTGSPYVGYTRVKTPSGAETIIPVCKDPYCTGCQFGGGGGAGGSGGMNGLMAAAAAAGFPGFASSASAGICPAGCVQCDHQKFSFAGLPSPFGMSHPGLSAAAAALGYPPNFLSQHAAAVAQQQQQQQQQAQQQQAHQQQQQQAQQNAQRPYVCNWIVGDTYCGKRFPSSEELLQHLRTHTNLSTSSGSAGEAAAAVAAATAVHQQQMASLSSQSSLYSSALLSSSAAAAAAAAMHRTYPTPPLSPLSAARYHPYASSGKPGSLSSLVPHPQSLASYYPSPYSLYGQRIGPPVHP